MIAEAPAHQKNRLSTFDSPSTSTANRKTAPKALSVCQFRTSSQTKSSTPIMACEQCGAEPAQAHHDSYYPDRWLDVRWLCPNHHLEWHRENEPEWPSIFEFHP